MTYLAYVSDAADCWRHAGRSLSQKITSLLAVFRGSVSLYLELLSLHLKTAFEKPIHASH